MKLDYVRLDDLMSRLVLKERRAEMVRQNKAAKNQSKASVVPDPEEANNMPVGKETASSG